MKISLGSDHAGFELKEALKKALCKAGHTVDDVGPDSADRVDYPDFAKQVAQAVSANKADRGVLVCGSGIGMCIAANRVAKVRAAVLRSQEDARLSREHNDANIACFGERITDSSSAQAILEVFLSTDFAGGRHTGRVKKLES